MEKRRVSQSQTALTSSAMAFLVETFPSNGDSSCERPACPLRLKMLLCIRAGASEIKRLRLHRWRSKARLQSGPASICSVSWHWGVSDADVNKLVGALSSFIEKACVIVSNGFAHTFCYKRTLSFNACSCGPFGCNCDLCGSDVLDSLTSPALYLFGPLTRKLACHGVYRSAAIHNWYCCSSS